MTVNYRGKKFCNIGPRRQNLAADLSLLHENLFYLGQGVIESSDQSEGWRKDGKVTWN